MLLGCSYRPGTTIPSRSILLSAVATATSSMYATPPCSQAEWSFSSPLVPRITGVHGAVLRRQWGEMECGGFKLWRGAMRGGAPRTPPQGGLFSGCGPVAACLAFHSQSAVGGAWCHSLTYGRAPPPPSCLP